MVEPLDSNDNLAARRIWSKLECLHCPERPDRKTLPSLKLNALHPLCFVAAVAVLPGACATARPAEAIGPAPTQAADAAVAAPAAAPEDRQALIGFARLAGVLDLDFASGFVDRMVRWQLDARDAFHRVQDRFDALAQATGIVIPDLTVLVTEPVAHTESSGFGWRDDPIRHTRRFHSGTDFRGKRGTPVVAAGDGIVTFCGRRGGYGNVIDINHGGGVITRYAHLRRIETTKDAAITAGERIGEVGSTGRATGPHLHFEVRLDGSPVSPISALAIATLQRESPLAGRLAALSLSPELQAIAESDVDPPKQRGRSTQRPEREGRAKRRQVLW
jgi:murein DD-endopeptidase MepM/ murein hydrolase activator NlpD